MPQQFIPPMPRYLEYTPVKIASNPDSESEGRTALARELSYLPVVWGVIVIVTFGYVLVVKSAEVYRTSRQFMITVLIALAASLALSAVLLLLFRIDTILVIMITTLMTFIIGHLGSQEYERPGPQPKQEEHTEMLVEADLRYDN
ncbi:MAG TPA: hypothetical protein VFQ36_03455 [Ktedonobacteraceae bacterium]|nr:hypothetical protein [Ktedonobacteraceae bacterium]